MPDNTQAIKPNSNGLSHAYTVSSPRPSVNSSVIGVLLDWDNTLIDAEHHYAEAYKQTFRDLAPVTGVPPWEDFTAEQKTQRNNEFLTERYGLENLELARNTLRKNMLETKATLRPHAKKLIAWLRQEHIPFGVISNAKQEIIEKQVPELLGEGILAIGSSEHFPKKPDTTGIKHMLKQLNLSPNKGSVLLVGDTVNTDVQVALDTGLQPLLIERPESVSKQQAEFNKLVDNSQKTAEKSVGYVHNLEDVQAFIAAQNSLASPPNSIRL